MGQLTLSFEQTRHVTKVLRDCPVGSVVIILGEAWLLIEPPKIDGLFGIWAVRLPGCKITRFDPMITVRVTDSHLTIKPIEASVEEPCNI